MTRSMKQIMLLVALLVTLTTHAQESVSESLPLKTKNANWSQTVVYTRPQGKGPVLDVTYYNGLGYPMQAIEVGTSLLERSVVTWIEYDSMRRGDARIRLPFTASRNQATLVTDPAASQQRYYRSDEWTSETQGGTYTYIENWYDSSPLNRVTHSIRPGVAYRSPGLKSAQYVNDVCADGEVLRLEIIDTTVLKIGVLWPWLGVTGHFPKGALSKNTTCDEDGVTTHTFTDGAGKTRLTRVETPQGDVDTYYVYDFSGRLAWVVTPEGSIRLKSGGRYAGDSEFARDYCYYYTYDGQGQLSAKHLAGSHNNEFFIYDKAGRLAKHCSGNYTYTPGNLLPDLRRIGKIGDFDKNKPFVMITHYTHQWKSYLYDSHNRVRQQWQFTACNKPEAAENFQDIYYQVDSLLTAEYRYDNYEDVPASLAFVAADSVPDYACSVAGSKTYERLQVLESRSETAPVRYHERAYYYDRLGRLCQQVERMADGTLLRCSYGYDFPGHVIFESEDVSLVGQTTPDCKRTQRSYDSRGRLLEQRTWLNGSNPAEVHYAYDDLGRLTAATYGPPASDSLPDPEAVREQYRYNLQGWLTSKTGNYFTEELRYCSPTQGATPSYTGHISEMTWWGDQGDTRQTYAFGYDALGRLRGADHFEGNRLAQRFTERNLTYDRNGNIQTLTRTEDSVSTHYTYRYKGPRLHRIEQADSRMLSALGSGFILLPDRDTTSFLPEKDTTAFPKPPVGPVNPPQLTLDDANFYPYPVVGAWSRTVPKTTEVSVGGDSCRYDMVGNQTYDPITGHRLWYNTLNRIEKISSGVSDLANYSYLWDGTKLSALNGSGEGYSYLGSLVYRTTDSGLVLESTDFPGGRLVASYAGGVFSPLYFQTDHLGSVRAVVSETRVPTVHRTVVERNDYHPYGLTWSDAQRPVTDNRYRYNGKEDQAFLSVGQIDYGARHYNPLTGRWFTPDELSEKYFGVGAYVFCLNNPIKFLDKDGRIPLETIWDAANVVDGVRSLFDNISAGNVGGAVVDGIGVVIDVAATLTPYVPGGVHTAIKSTRIAAKTVDKAADAARTIDHASDGSGSVKKTFQTYTKTRSADGKVYSGRTSGTKSPEQNVIKRDRNHHKNKEGYGPARMDRTSTDPDAIRGREQQLIEENGGATVGGGTSGNTLNGVSPKNPKKKTYDEARKKILGT